MGARSRPRPPAADRSYGPAGAATQPPAAAGRWQEVARQSNLLAPDGSLASTIFAEMSALAVRTGAINLGQGFPDTDGPTLLLESAREAVSEGRNQYAPGIGV